MDYKKPVLSFISLLIVCLSIDAQVTSNVSKLKSIAEYQHQKTQTQKDIVREYAKTLNIPIRIVLNEKALELQYIDRSGNPQYLVTNNATSAETISTDEVYSGGEAGLSLDGDSITVHLWDAGSARETHQEFDTRVTVGDGSNSHWHSTHVGGTLIASGVESNAKGMAYGAGLVTFDWNDFNTEMASEAAAGAIISNHSYGWLRGWEGGTWWGDPAISDQEDYLFGFYDDSAETWDDIAYNAPYFLIVKSAGNDRNNCGDGSYPCDGPYDCIDQLGIAKNNLVVAAVDDIPGGYTQPSDVNMSSFSSWGPADDGRIKPDISANGVGLYSTNNGSDDDYRSASGTSMSAPSVAGSVALLQQHYEQLNGNDNFMKSATVKALVIHTADETGSGPGPDYEFGWGLMNTMKAANKISENDTSDVIFEDTLTENDSYTFEFIAADSGLIKVTLAWTDPAGTPPSTPSLDPEDIMLVNDLDLKIENLETGELFYPWKLDKDNPADPATNDSKNEVDNVEQVYIPAADSGADYLVTVEHEGTLESGSQDFSLIFTFTTAAEPVVEAPVTDFVADKTNPLITDTVFFTDLSTNTPTAWSWDITPNFVEYIDGTDSASQNPIVTFDSVGIYDVSMTSSNEGGASTETKLNYITVFDILTLSVLAIPDTICEGDSTQLQALAVGGTGDYEYEWTSNPPGFSSSWSNPTDAPSETTIYLVEVSDGIQTVQDSVQVIVNPLPEIIPGDWPEDLCNEDEEPVQLESTPTGGTYSGENVTETGLFDPDGIEAGWYPVTYTFTDGNSCANSATDSIFVHDCVGLEDFPGSKNVIRVFPNPGKGTVNVESNVLVLRIEVYSQQGKVILVTTPRKLKDNIFIGTKGIYFLKVITEKKTSVLRILVN